MAIPLTQNRISMIERFMRYDRCCKLRRRDALIIRRDVNPMVCTIRTTMYAMMPSMSVISLCCIVYDDGGYWCYQCKLMVVWCVCICNIFFYSVFGAGLLLLFLLCCCDPIVFGSVLVLVVVVVVVVGFCCAADVVVVAVLLVVSLLIVECSCCCM